MHGSGAIVLACPENSSDGFGVPQCSISGLTCSSDAHRGLQLATSWMCTTPSMQKSVSTRSTTGGVSAYSQSIIVLLLEGSSSESYRYGSCIQLPGQFDCLLGVTMGSQMLIVLSILVSSGAEGGGPDCRCQRCGDFIQRAMNRPPQVIDAMPRKQFGPSCDPNSQNRKVWQSRHTILTYCISWPGSRLPLKTWRQLHGFQVPLPCPQEGLRGKLYQGAYTQLLAEC